VAPLAAKYEYAMFGNKDLLLLQDGIIADAIHLNRRLGLPTRLRSRLLSDRLRGRR
jgi:hypothetical protein